jgi:uncharacterized protein YbjT (DUF2867 family)
VTPTVLVIGASGKTGRAVTRALVGRGFRVRAATRTPEALPYAAGLAAAVADGSARGGSPSSDPVVQAVLVDLETGLGLDAAMAGVGAVYHLAPNVHPDEVRIARRVSESAAAAGVSRLVFHSVLHPHDSRMPHHLRKGEAEEVIRARLPGATVLRPAAYHQNLLGGAANGLITVPYSLDSPFTNVDLEDVADVAAQVLTEVGHEGATYELAGPEALSVREMASIASDVLKRPVAAERETAEAWAAEAPGLDEGRRAALFAMFGAYDREGFVGDATTLTGVLGRPAATWGDVLARGRAPLGA